MTQQLNLYDASLRPTRELLSLGNLALAVGGTFVVLIALALFGMGRGGEEMGHFKAAEARLRQAQEQLTVLAVQQASRKLDPALELALEQVRHKLAAKQEVLERLRTGEFGDRRGFHAFFHGLAAVAVDGLWLTGFDVAAAGGALEIRGRMLSESALPRYVDALRRQPAFVGREFSALNVTRAAEAKAGEEKRSTPSVIDFSLSGTPAGAPAAEVAR